MSQKTCKNRGMEGSKPVSLSRGVNNTYCNNNSSTEGETAGIYRLKLMNIRETAGMITEERAGRAGREQTLQKEVPQEKTHTHWWE